MFTWIIGHILSNLPSWLWPAVAGGGFGIYLIAGLAGHFPTIKPYAFIIRPIALITTVVGIFMYGGAGVTAIYQAQMEELQQKIAVAEQASKDANTAIQTKIVTQTKVIHDTKIVYQDRIKEIEKKIDADCKMDPEAIKILNDASVDPLGAKK